ncbi:MAG: hypothetical protein J1D87_04270 [Lachnospiraceae bacterium]|nr:hypothetical protein [Lachnospiraceae bacterium]
MKLQDLKDAVNNIEIDDAMQEEILENVSKRTKGKKTVSFKTNTGRKNVSGFSRIAVTAAGVVLAVGIIGFPVRALVTSLVKERMEKISEEERHELVEMLDSQGVEVDGFSREYTAEEKNRMKELRIQYQQGVFPEGELPQADSVEEAETMELCYLTTNSTYYLPDRELTDEEILQIIDFQTKLDYSLSKRYEEEYADEIAAKEQAQKELVAQVADSGGITEEEAVTIAKEWLEKIHGITGDGLELHHRLDGDLEDNAKSGESTQYVVTWSGMSNEQHYYFFISARDGRLTQTIYTTPDMVRNTKNGIAPEEMEAQLPELKEKAISFITEILDEDVESYVESYLIYNIYDENRTGNSVEFTFIKESGEADIIYYTCNGTFTSLYRTSDIEDYRKGKVEREEFIKERSELMGETFRKKEIAIDLNEL